MRHGRFSFFEYKYRRSRTATEPLSRTFGLLVIEDNPPTRRRIVALAGHRGHASTVREFLGDADPSVRAIALASLERCGALTAADLRTGLADDSPTVRTRAAELAATHPDVSILETLADRQPLVLEMAAWAAGERPTDAEVGAVVAALIALAGEHRDPLVREAAVAAIGSLEAQAGRKAVLAALSDKPNIRRRAVLALVAFEGPDIDEALQQATHDRDWQVRDAAEELLRITQPD